MADQRKENDRKARGHEGIDFIHHSELRKHRRFGSSAFKGTPVVLTPAPPFFGATVEGKLVDLSGGGAAVQLHEAVPVKTKLKIWMVLPEREAIACTVIVRRVISGKNGFLTGVEFADLSEPAATDLINMSADFDGCEARIRHEESPICLPTCTFLSLCDKPQKTKN